MKRKSTLLLLLAFCIFYSYAQPASQWAHCYGGTYDDVAKSIIQTSDGGYAVTGYSESNNGDVTGHHGGYGFADYWILKIDSLGNIQWSQSYGGTQVDEGYCIIQTSDNGFAVAGYATSVNGDVTGNHGGSDMWIIKTDSVGTLQWEKCFGGSWDEVAYSLVETNDKGYVIAGSARSTDGDVGTNRGWPDVWILKIDSAANIVWKLDCGGTQEDIAYAVSKTSDQGFIVAGSSRSNDQNVGFNYGDADYWVIKMDSNGTVQWGKVLGGTEEDAAYAVTETRDGGYIISGTSNSDDFDITGNHASFDNWIVKLDSARNVVWQRSFGGTGYDGGQSLAPTNDSGFIALGSSYSEDGDVTGIQTAGDYWMLKVGSDGSLQWQKALGGTRSDAGYGIIQTSDKGFAAVGGSESHDGNVSGNHNDYTSDFWVVKIAPYTVGIGEIEDASSGIIIFPNPARDQFTINMQQSAMARIEVYDVVGELLYSGEKPKGQKTYSLKFDFAPGLYFVKLDDGNFVSVKKLVVD